MSYDRALLDQAKKRGALFLQKPYPLDELFRSLNEALDQRLAASTDVVALSS
jgi:hypothetical protein